MEGKCTSGRVGWDGASASTAVAPICPKSGATAGTTGAAQHGRSNAAALQGSMLQVSQRTSQPAASSQHGTCCSGAQCWQAI